jgi:hypothetical protein
MRQGQRGLIRNLLLPMLNAVEPELRGQTRVRSLQLPLGLPLHVGSETMVEENAAVPTRATQLSASYQHQVRVSCGAAGMLSSKLGCNCIREVV